MIINGLHGSSNIKPSMWAIDPGIIACNASRMGLPLLRAYWPSWEGAGNRIDEIFGNNNIGIISGAVWNIAQRGRLLKFNGTTNYVDMGNNFPMLGDEISFSLWIYLTEHESWSTILSKGASSDSGYHDWSLLFNQTADTIYMIRNGDNLVASTATIPRNKWCHFAGSVSASVTKMWFNGILDSTQGGTGNGDTENTAGRPVRFMSNVDRCTGGFLCDVQIYDSILSNSQAAVLSQNFFGLVQQPSMEELWAYVAAGGEEHEKNLSDMINMTDARIASFGLNKADSMSLSDSISKGFGLNKADSITLSDSIIKAFGLNKGDTVNLSDSISSKTFGLNKADTILLSDSISSKGFGLNRADNIALSDSIAKSFSFSKADTINMSDEISTLIAIIKNLADTINISDAISSKTFGLNKSDIISLSDGVAKEFGLSKVDTINMTDEAIKAAGLSLSDNITLSDSLDSAVLSALAALYNFLAKNKTFNFNAKAKTFNFNAKAKTFNFNAKAKT